MPRRFVSRLVSLAVLCAIWAPASAQPRQPLDFAPSESLLVWAGRPLPDAPPPGSEPSALQTLLDLGTRLAGPRLDAQAQLGVRMAELFGLTVRYPHAFVLIDAKAKPLENDPDARRVDRLRFALIVQNRGQAEPFLRVIQKAVNEQTNRGAATLKSLRAERWSYQQLQDERLPDWSAIAWGHIDEHFVLTVGEEVWPQIAAVATGEFEAITNNAWYAIARAPHRARALIEIFVQAREIRARLDPFVSGRASGFFEAWDADALAQSHWAIGFEGRALFCEACFQVGEQTVRRVYADPDWNQPQLDAVVPEQTRHAIFRVPTERFIARFFAGWVAVQGAEARANIKRAWRELQRQRDFDARRDILAHLGDHVVVHNFPPHPLSLPLAMTTLIEIRDAAPHVRRTMETLCEGWQAIIEDAAARSPAPPDFTVHRDADGVWYLRFGPLAGLAWTTTDQFIILSWSPNALREYLARVGPAVGTR